MGACGDAPVMLVNNNRMMLSFMTPDKLDALLDELRAECAAESGSEMGQRESEARRRTAETCSTAGIYGRRSVIMGLDGQLAPRDYEARGGYRRCARSCPRR
jgi:hypothetical protein